MATKKTISTYSARVSTPRLAHATSALAARNSFLSRATRPRAWVTSDLRRSGSWREVVDVVVTDVVDEHTVETNNCLEELDANDDITIKDEDKAINCVE